MKKYFGIIMLFALFTTTTATAQINLNVNIGSQPLWGPTGYDHVEYYYLPDIETYYSVPQQQFIYLNNGNWVFDRALPARFANYNIYNGYKVVINQPTPYLNFKTHKIKYAKYKNWGGKQMVIKNSSNQKYFVVKGHPHGGPPGQMKGKGANHGNGKGKGKH